MSSHTVLIGYSMRGRLVVAALRESGHTTGVTVVESDPELARQAVVDGVRAVVGPGWRLRSLWMAGVHLADHVVVAVLDDPLALRITSAVRSLNESATLITVVRSPDLQEVVARLGADHVVDVDQAAEWTLEPQHRPDVAADLSDLEWAVAERSVLRHEIGSSPLDCSHQVLAVVREGRRIWASDPAVAALREGDLLVVLSGMPT